MKTNNHQKVRSKMLENGTLTDVIFPLRFYNGRPCFVLEWSDGVTELAPVDPTRLKKVMNSQFDYVYDGFVVWDFSYLN